MGSTVSFCSRYYAEQTTDDHIRARNTDGLDWAVFLACFRHKYVCVRAIRSEEEDHGPVLARDQRCGAGYKIGERMLQSMKVRLSYARLTDFLVQNRVLSRRSQECQTSVRQRCNSTSYNHEYLIADHCKSPGKQNGVVVRYDTDLGRM
jgi:hypothetical protein